MNKKRVGELVAELLGELLEPGQEPLQPLQTPEPAQNSLEPLKALQNAQKPRQTGSRTARTTAKAAPSSKPLVVCSECRERKPKYCRGMCISCYNADYNKGKINPVSTAPGIDTSELPNPIIPMDRKCLKCGKMFPSSGPSNRICGDCSGILTNHGFSRPIAK